MRRGYDEVAERYLYFTEPHIATRHEWLARARAKMRPGSTVLDLGCGAMTATRTLVDGFTVVGVDLSMEQLRMARSATGGAALVVQSDMSEVAVRPGSIGAVVSMWAFLHVPREEHAGILRRIAEWLEPGGAFLGSFGTTDDPGSIENFLGAPMFFSHFDADASIALVSEAGLSVEEAALVTEPDGTRSPWVLALRP